MDNELQQIAQNLKDEMTYRDGVITFSIRASARLIGVDEKSIRKGADFEDSKVSQLLAQCRIHLRTFNNSI